MPASSPILVTGAAGSVGGVGRTIVELLRQRDLDRAMVHREDDRAAALRKLGAEVVVGDLTRAIDIQRAMAGCRRIYFGMSVSASYLEATATAAAVVREQGHVARDQGDLEVFVNISQLTLSQMSLTESTGSPQAPAALAGRAGAQLVRLARRARPPDGLPAEPDVPRPGGRHDRGRQQDPAAVRRRPHLAGRHAGRRRSDRGHPLRSGPTRQ
jgi:NADPH:quinone reductase-like Zn-dependent oxidoreductase